MSRFTVMGLAAVFVLAIGSVACGREPELTGVTDRFRRLAERPAALDEAENRLIGQCMNRAGMAYPQVPVSQDDRPMNGLLRGAAPLRAEVVRDHGYPDKWMDNAPTPGRGPVETYADSLPIGVKARFYHSLRGEGGNNVRVSLPGGFEVAASSSGCVGSARRQLYRSVDNYLTVFYLPELVRRRASSANEDPDVREAHAAFARCMSIKGHRTATPSDAVALARTYYPDGRREKAGDQEKLLALADAECQTAVRLHERRAAAVDRVTQRWLDDNEAAISKAHRLLQEALIEANSVMGR